MSVDAMEYLYGSFPEPERCAMTQTLVARQCPELAFWRLERTGAELYVCERCMQEAVRRLTSRQQSIVVSRYVPPTKRIIV